MPEKMAANREEARAEIREQFGFVPEFYDALPEEGFHAFWGLQRDFEDSEDTVLDMKTKHLIGLAVAGQMKCEYCAYFHTRAADALGASQEELREAAAMGGVTAVFSNSLNGMMVDYETFQSDTNRAIENMMEDQ